MPCYEEKDRTCGSVEGQAADPCAVRRANGYCPAIEQRSSTIAVFQRLATRLRVAGLEADGEAGAGNSAWRLRKAPVGTKPHLQKRVSSKN